MESSADGAVEHRLGEIVEVHVWRVASVFHRNMRGPVAPARSHRKMKPEEVLEERLVVFCLRRQALNLHFKRTALVQAGADLAVAGPWICRRGFVRFQEGLTSTM